MLRATASAFTLACLSSTVLAATEEDRRNCASHQSADTRIAACTRVIEFQASTAAQRVMAYRHRGNSYGNRNLHELANLDFEEALKLSPQDQGALNGRARSFSAIRAISITRWPTTHNS